MLEFWVSLVIFMASHSVVARSGLRGLIVQKWGGEDLSDPLFFAQPDIARMAGHCGAERASYPAMAMAL